MGIIFIFWMNYFFDGWMVRWIYTTIYSFRHDPGNNIDGLQFLCHEFVCIGHLDHGEIRGIVTGFAYVDSEIGGGVHTIVIPVIV